ncbi:hypothetical protein MNBD_NITROSPINAE04-1043 [hydrothermal vent metagenome]|uniref:Uncharacterized protein n=1 Tax=hydrothermal vent metagenome TaxID=652676 RepID=A0A3B1BUQ9_9ZZZZ
MNLKLIAKLAGAVRWAVTPQGKKTIKTAAQLAKDKEKEIEAVQRFVKNHASKVVNNTKQAVKNFRDELGKKD